MAKKKIFERRMPMYFGGLLLGLAAMVGIFQAKRAMMPKFHEVKEEREEAVIAPGGGVRFVYTEDPGYFLPPGFPTKAIIYHRQSDTQVVPLVRAPYGSLVEKDPLVGPMVDEGKYALEAEFFICAGPGVPDCTKLSLSQEIRVDRESKVGESRVEIDLARFAQQGVEAGGNKPLPESAGEPEKKEEPAPEKPKEE